MQHSVGSSQQPCEGGSYNHPILQMRKLRKMKGLAQDHTVGTWRSLDLDLGCIGSEAQLIP